MKIVSLCPSLTKLIFDLGKGAWLVGVTRYCVHPREAVAGIEKVGGTKNPDLERIVALAPDLVFFNREENRRQDWRALREAGLNCRVTYPVSLEETEATILAVGKALGSGRQAARMAARIAGLRALLAAQNIENKTFAYMIWRKPWMTVNRRTYIHHLLEAAGGINVFAGLENLYPAVESSQLAAADPDLVLLSSEPFPFKEKHRVALAAETGLPRERFLLVDGALLSWHCSLTEQGLVYAAELFGNKEVLQPLPNREAGLKHSGGSREPHS